MCSAVRHCRPFGHTADTAGMAARRCTAVQTFRKWPCGTQVWIGLTDRINKAQRRQRLALSTCVRCHSGGMMGPVACENGWGRGPLH